MSVFPGNVNFGSTHDGHFRRDLLSDRENKQDDMESIPYGDENDQNLVDPPIKKHLFCNRRGCGKKRGKREPQTFSRSDSFCNRIKCVSKRFLCNRGGCRSKRVDRIVSEIYCSGFTCPASRDESTDFTELNPVTNGGKSTVQSSFVMADNYIPQTNTDDVGNAFATDPDKKLFLLNLMRKSISQQINLEKYRELQTAMCQMYGLCENNGDAFFFK